MSHDEKQKEERHYYDGIYELDNPAPGWWQIMFYASIAFGIGYYAYFEMWGGSTSDERLNAALAKIETVKREAGPQGPSDQDYSTALASVERVKKGQEVYVSKCSSCHAADGGGLIGPNLADAYWIHGDGSVAGIAKVVADGVLDKGMPPWGAVLSREELIEVVAFVKSIDGKPVAQAKAPQGVAKK